MQICHPSGVPDLCLRKWKTCSAYRLLPNNGDDDMISVTMVRKHDILGDVCGFFTISGTWQYNSEENTKCND